MLILETALSFSAPLESLQIATILNAACRQAPNPKNVISFTSFP